MLNSKPKVQILPGIDGVPFRMPANEQIPFIKSTDTRQPVEVLDAHVRIFDLSDKKDLKEYTEVMDMVAKGRCLFSAEDRQWDPEKKTFIVFLRWLTRFMEMPKNGTTTENGQSISFK